MTDLTMGNAVAEVPTESRGTAVRRWVMPIVAALGVLCAMLLIVVPMLKATPTNIPVGILSLDTGATTPAGQINAGATIVQQVTGAASPLAWTTYSSQADLQAALDNNDLYAALTIPADFSTSQVAAKMDPTKTASPIVLTVDQGKNPTVASAVEAMFAAMTAKAGVTLTTTVLNPVPADMGSGTIALVIGLVTTLASMVTGIVLAVSTRPTAPTRGKRAATLGGQTVYAVILAGLIGLGAATVGRLAGVSLPFAQVTAMAGVASLALLAIILACVDWLGTPGILIPALIMLLGMPTLILPGEFLPAFWRDWVYPWAPQRFTGDGLRQVLFLGKSWWNVDAMVLTLTAIVGLVVAYLTLLPARVLGRRGTVPGTVPNNTLSRR